MSEMENKLPCDSENTTGSVENTTPSEPKKSSFIKELIIQTEIVVIAFSIIILAFAFVVRTCEVRGRSMEDTLQSKDLVLCSNLFYSPKKGDIIVFHQTGAKYNEPIVKRVIGLPGDTVKIEYLADTMKVTVTDTQGDVQVLEEDYIKYSDPNGYSDSTTVVEEGTVFVLGDNRSNSADSRNVNIGLVDQRRILGKVIFRILPLSEFGTVD